VLLPERVDVRVVSIFREPIEHARHVARQRQAREETRNRKGLLRASGDFSIYFNDFADAQFVAGERNRAPGEASGSSNALAANQPTSEVEMS